MPVFDFLASHAELANVILNMAMVVIWTVYLQIFLASHLRQARSVIHIDIGAAKGMDKRCLVTNLSSSAIYIQALIADLEVEGESYRTLITEKDEILDRETDDPLSHTNRGTLQHGQTIDIGSLEDVMSRARIRLGQSLASEQVITVAVTVVAVSGQVDRIVAARKAFEVDGTGSSASFIAKNLLTRQFRPRQTRAAFGDLLRDGPVRHVRHDR